MADYVVMPKADYQDILDATREKTGKSDLLLSGEVGTEIRGISSGGNGVVPSGTKEIIANGEYDISLYEKADVNVPVPDGYVQPSGTKQITENGTHDVSGYASAEVDVETPTEELTVTENGEYTPSDGKHFSKVTVNVAQSSGDSSASLGALTLAYVDDTYYCPNTITVESPVGDGYVYLVMHDDTYIYASNTADIALNDAFGDYGDEHIYPIYIVAYDPATNAVSNASDAIGYYHSADDSGSGDEGGSSGGGTGTNILTINAQGSTYAPDATYTHALAVTINSGATMYFSAETSCVETYDDVAMEYMYSYPLTHVVNLDNLSESDTVVIICENVRGDGTPVAVDGVGCTAVAGPYYDEDGIADFYTTSITITNITDGASVTLEFDADY